MDFQLDSTVRRNEENFLANPVGDEIIILNMETGDYLGLNAVGSFIWEQMSEPVRVRQILDKLQAAYTVDEATCLRETLMYLERMKGFGLLQMIP
jgi:ferritin